MIGSSARQSTMNAITHDVIGTAAEEWEKILYLYDIIKKNCDSNNMIGGKNRQNGRDAVVYIMRARIMQTEPRIKRGFL